MADQMVTSDHTKKLDINVGGDSPHIVTYRIWYMAPSDSSWTKIGDGHTADGFPDHHTCGPFVDGTRIAYYVIIVGNALTNFATTVTISQDGQILPGGVCTETGRLTENRRVVRQRKLVLK